MFEVTFNLKKEMVARWGVIYLLVVERLYLSLQTKEITNLRNYYTIIENTDLKLKLFY
jgi:hypothetical protein